MVASVAPGAEMVVAPMLGADNRGKGRALAAAIDWTVSQRIEVVNLSLSSRSEQMYAALHDIADRSYFANTLLVCAANNAPGPSYPSLFASVVSVAAHDVPDPDVWFYNPITAGRVRCLWGRRRRRVARRRPDPRDRQLLRRPASRRVRRRGSGRATRRRRRSRSRRCWPPRRRVPG